MKCITGICQASTTYPYRANLTSNVCLQICPAGRIISVDASGESYCAEMTVAMYLEIIVPVVGGVLLIILIVLVSVAIVRKRNARVLGDEDE